MNDPLLNLDLLARLVAAGGEGVAVETLEASLALAPARLRADLDALREAGYGIERTHPHGSAAYRLRDYPDRLFAHEVERRLTTRWVGLRVTSLKSCASTNDVARDLARAGAPSGTVVLAEEQTAGRGRAGRSWESARGLGIYLSLVYRPEGEAPSPSVLQIGAGVAVAHAVMRLTGESARMRWPNDVLAEGGKVAGLLVEAPAVPAGTAYVVGIGLNVNQRASDFPPEIAETATSLSRLAGRKLSRLDVLTSLLSSLEEWLDRVAGGEVERITRAWRPLSSLLGRAVTLVRGEGRVTGRVTDLSALRGILLETPDGASGWVPAEHVYLIRPADEMTGK